MAFEIITDSSANLTREMAKKLDVRILSLSFFLGEDEYKSYPEDKEFDYSWYYDALRKKEPARTSLVSVDCFKEAFEDILKEEKDILAVVVSSGLSGTYQSAKIAADTLREQYPHREIIVIDSLSASVGQGLLVYYAAKMKQEGKSIEEIADWIYKNRLNMVHQFTVDDLFFLKRGGRLSGGVAIIGTILQIKPVLHVDNEGHLIAQEKINGRKKSINRMVEIMKENGKDLDNQVVAICHGDCIEDAEYLKKKVQEIATPKEIIVVPLDPVLGAHAGPGTVAVFYLGKER